MNRRSVLVVAFTMAVVMLTTVSRVHGQADVTPPRVTGMLPLSGGWVVDGVGLKDVRINFSERVTIPSGSIRVWTQSGGSVTAFSTSYDATANVFKVTFGPRLKDDRVTIMLDQTVKDLAGNVLDGEIANPFAATLPSGDGIQGGQTVVRINVLQGDANRDGITNNADLQLVLASLFKCSGQPGYNANADLNNDGCVTNADKNIVQQALNKSLQILDNSAPIVASLTPDPEEGLSTSLSNVQLTFSEPIRAAAFTTRSCYLLRENGALINPASASLAANGLSATYTFNPPLDGCGTYDVRLNNSLADLSSMLLAPPAVAPRYAPGVPVSPTINPHPTLTNSTSISITGLAPQAGSVRVTGPLGSFEVPAAAGVFAASVPLKVNTTNQIYIASISSCNGSVSAPTATQVTNDQQPPGIFIQHPVDAAEIYTASTDVAGTVGDMLSGFMGLNVTVNGIPAAVDVGIGNNGSFVAMNVPLNAPDVPTVIAATATDQLGNTITKQVTVTQKAIPPNSPTITATAGNGQSSMVGTELASPIEVQVLRGDGTPFANKVVTFHVKRNDGRLSDLPGASDGSMMLQVFSDAQGMARAFWKLGGTAGCGNNRVEVTAHTIFGTVAFCASGTPGVADQINIGSGNNQKGEVDSALGEPLRAWVSDACNPVAGIPVTFTVTEGGGKVNGQDQVTMLTGVTGHVPVQLTLGPEAGRNAVVANFAGNPSGEATFVAYGVERDPATPTSFTGLVLDNASRPIGGAEILLTVNGVDLPAAFSNTQGQFNFVNIPSGPAHIHINGLTANLLNGQAIPQGSFPALAYAPVVIPNVENSLLTPVLLPMLDPANANSTYSSNPNGPDTILTCNGMEGLRMIVAAGSMRLPNGQPAPNGTILALNQVHHDEVPMPMPDGVASPFAWTIQPGGATFDPPIAIEYPNMSSLPPGALANFLNFNHDTNRFEIVAPGSVSEDGSVIMTDPGTGLSDAAWGCNCPPYAVVGECYGPCSTVGVSNGCGTDTGIGQFVPDNVPIFLPTWPPIPCGIVQFANGMNGPCDNHDRNWSICGMDKVESDLLFLQDLLEACQSTFLPNLPCLGSCTVVAFMYYAAVAIDPFEAYDAAQQHAQCCGCPVHLTVQQQVFGLGGPVPPYQDVDQDLIPDNLEILYGLSPSDPHDSVEDPDEDGLINIWEVIAGTDPFVADTDGDGINDFTEIQASQPTWPQHVTADWTVAVNGQVAIGKFDGTFNIDNVSAPDAFGLGGPGTSPDFLSDDFVRLVAVRPGTPTRYAFSDRFQFSQNQTFNIDEVVFSTTPPPTPQSLLITGPTGVLLSNQTFQLTVTATLNNGQQQDVTPRSAWTVYRTSNPAVAKIGPDGLVDAEGPGIAFITAGNDAVTAVKKITVTPATDPLTTVQGFVQLADGTPVSGANVGLFNLPNMTTTGPDGGFMLTQVPTLVTNILTVRVSAVISGMTLFGTSPDLTPVPMGITDAGVISLDDTGGFGPIIVSGMDPEDHGTAGQQMIRDLMTFCVDNSVLHVNPHQILMLGGNATIGNNAASLAAGLGYTLTRVNGAGITNADINPATTPFDMIYMPTADADVGGGLSLADLALINARGNDIIAFINGGGGLAAFSNNHSGGYNWFPLGGLQTVAVSSSGITVTPAGQFVLSPSATQVEPFHTAFTGPPGFFGLDVLATESSGQMRPLIIGGLANIPPGP